MKKVLTPPRVILLGYIIIILIGASLLTLPAASPKGRCSFTDSVFTATSGVCVTGLIVKDTANDFTRFGKTVILTLIQIGGLGYMTIASLLFLTIGGRLSIRQAGMTKEAILTLPGFGGIGRFVLLVVGITVGVELIGFIILTTHFLALGFTLESAFFNGLFHSVSAFCNAGFALFSDSLVRFARDGWMISTISGLLIIGGLGFIVLREIYFTIVGQTFRFARLKPCPTLSLHTKLVLWSTLGLLIVGTFGIMGIEWGGVFKSTSLKYKFYDAFFQASTPRTAGFTVVPIGEYKLGSLFLTILLMFIGASPGGTGGGIKTTTTMLLIMSMVAYFRGRKSVTGFGRRVEESVTQRAFTVALMSVLILIAGIMVLTLTQCGKSFIGLVFETFSAFGTVGLSMGSIVNPACSLSYDFTSIGKFAIVLTMLAGRVGSLTIGTALIQRVGRETFKLPHDTVLTG